MPARASKRTSVPASTKPKRETKKPTTYVPGIAPEIAKPKRTTAAKGVKKAAPKKAPKRAVKTAAAKKAKAPATKTPTKAAKGTPKKAIKKPASRTANASHPKYIDMIVEGIKSSRKKSVSRQAIEKYIDEHYKLKTDTGRWIRQGLSKLVQDGKIQKVKASYRMTPKKVSVKTKPTKAKSAKPKVKKPKVPKAPKAKKPKKASPSTAVAAGSTAVAAEGTGKPIWQYHHNTWQNYDQQASDLVEEQYQEWLSNNQMFDVRSVKSGNFEYNVDFRRNVQTNIQHPSHTEREIRRHVA